jgi:predicted nucleic acid-binding protein
VTVYVDSSVLLRFILDQPGSLTGVLERGSALTCFITEVECLRAVEAARLRRQLTADEAADRRWLAYRYLRRVRRMMPSMSVLRRAGEPYPLALKSLDAIHLASALVLRDQRDPYLVFATHDRQLGRAAATMGFEVIGL